MLTLEKVKINKYKSFLQEQEITFEDNITTIVGKNESGKTAFLEALAKFNYFQDDEKFKFDDTYDYPKSEWKKFQKAGDDVEVIICTYKIQDELLNLIASEVGENVFQNEKLVIGANYKNNKIYYNLNIIFSNFIIFLGSKYNLPTELKEEMGNVENFNKLEEFVSTKEELTDIKELIEKINISNKLMKLEEPLNAYIVNKFISPNIPKFWYFDEYYNLPSKININELNAGHIKNLSDEEFQTAKALFEISNIDIDELLNTDNFESFISELEATSNDITDQIFEYWSTNQNLEIRFVIENSPNAQTGVNDKILNIRIQNNKHRVSLPLQNRSRGFIWFFSFIVWFSKIHEDTNKNYILLLDEPGTNLHASAQADLLKFIEEKLSSTYQIIYSTHSPFMIDSQYLERVRTVYDSNDPKEGSLISDAIQEKDPDTLFPLQAALGYDIAQNLFISKNNLLVEGPTDLLYLTILSNILEENGREGLDNKFTIMPIGGLDKVTTFISLLRGSKLNVVCLLDSFKDQKGKQKLDDLIKHKIIKEKNIHFFDEFVKTTNCIADIEDLFDKDEYLKLFNDVFKEHKDIALKDLDPKKINIINQINTFLDLKGFNHYRPAYKLSQLGVDISYFSKGTLDRFESIFKTINK